MEIVLSSNRAALEYHLILCQSTSLVRKHVFYLSQVLIDVQCPALEGSVSDIIVHLHIPVDEINLDELDNHYSHIQRDWYEHLKREGRDSGS